MNINLYDRSINIFDELFARRIHLVTFEFEYYYDNSTSLHDYLTDIIYNILIQGFEKSEENYWFFMNEIYSTFFIKEHFNDSIKLSTDFVEFSFIFAKQKWERIYKMYFHSIYDFVQISAINYNKTVLDIQKRLNNKTTNFIDASKNVGKMYDCC